jgi:hypothetical protein
VLRLEATAYPAIAQEYEAERTIAPATTVTTRKQGRTAYTKARTRAADKIARAEAYRYLYQGLLEELRLFDETGQVRNRRTAEGKMQAALDLLDTLGLPSISKAVKTLRRLLPELLN